MGYQDQCAEPPENLDRLQVVINSFGREVRYVERAVNSILGQKHLPGKIHLIDQNSHPLTLPKSLQNESRLRHHHYPDPTCSRARNQAIDLISTGWIAFLDDDAYWTENYTPGVLTVMRRSPELGLIAGAVYDETTGRLYSLRQQLGGRLDHFSGSKLLAGANFLVRAEIFARVGGYDPRLGPGTSFPSSEEADLCWRLLVAGTRALYAPEIAVLHPPMHADAAGPAARKAYRYGLGKGALAAIWLIEKHHVYGLLEFIEMTMVPFFSLARGLLRRDWRQLRIQPAQWWGRQRSFWSQSACILRRQTR
jgi:GT2 family glycosyltransferase